LPSFEQMRRCSILAPSLACTSLKWTVFDSVAEYSLIGTFTRPKVMVPFQIERGAMGPGYPLNASGNRTAGSWQSAGFAGRLAENGNDHPLPAAS